MENKKTILIIEDEAEMVKALSESLSEAGYGIITSTNGEEGLSTALSKHPSLILLDVLMPKMDGLTMMKKLREDDFGKTVPVIILSNVSPENDSQIKSIIDNQPAYYFMKSNIRLDELREKVKEII